jgi:DNA repair protein RecN (Recombination protein N)
MIVELHIQDFAIIEELDLEFSPGFIVFTGETGAGKSIIIDAVELLLGSRAYSEVVRQGAEKALIEGIFRIEPAVRDDVHTILEREMMLDEPEFVTLSREVRSTGRSICRINGRAATAGLLRELGESLVDVHGQSEHLSLLRVPEHLKLLDRYAGTEQMTVEFGDSYHKLADLRHELYELRQKEKEAEARAELLAFQIREIKTADLKPGEDAELSEERTRLANAEQLAGLAEEAIAALDESFDGQSAATDRIGQVVDSLIKLAGIDPSMEKAQVEAETLAEKAGELARRIRLYREGMEFNPRRLDEVEERLGLIHSLQRKYGKDIQAVLAYAIRAEEELEAITHAEERIAELEDGQEELLHQLGANGLRLSKERLQAGEQLSEAIAKELKELRMAGARFGVDMRWEDDPDGVPVDGRLVAFHATGLDRIEFLVAPNPGEGLKSLTKIASGGETSRLMLGLKSVLARVDQTPTLIFDEIDQGIGGRAGAVVGKKLWRVAKEHQVLCITHLPQLAAFGDQHYKIEKQVVADRTVTRARPLKEQDRIRELALMFGSLTESNLESAAELRRRAKEAKTVAETG